MKPCHESEALGLFHTQNVFFETVKVNVYLSRAVTEGEAEAEDLFSCKQVLYSEPLRSGQEIKVLTSFGHSVKNPEVAMVRLYCWNQKTNMDLRPAC